MLCIPDRSTSRDPSAPWAYWWDYTQASSGGFLILALGALAGALAEVLGTDLEDTDRSAARPGLLAPGRH